MTRFRPSQVDIRSPRAAPGRIAALDIGKSAPAHGGVPDTTHGYRCPDSLILAPAPNYLQVMGNAHCGRLAAGVLLPLTLVGCSHSGEKIHETAVDRSVAVYSALLVAQLSIEPQLNRHVFVLPIPAGATQPLSSAIQTQVTAAVQVRKLAISWGNPTRHRDVRIVTLPQLPVRGDQFTVAVNDWCGDTCGHGLHYILRQHGDRWTATQTGGEAIS